MCECPKRKFFCLFFSTRCVINDFQHKREMAKRRTASNLIVMSITFTVYLVLHSFGKLRLYRMQFYVLRLRLCVRQLYPFPGNKYESNITWWRVVSSSFSSRCRYLVCFTTYAQDTNQAFLLYQPVVTSIYHWIVQLLMFTKFWWWIIGRCKSEETKALLDAVTG